MPTQSEIQLLLSARSTAAPVLNAAARQLGLFNRGIDDSTRSTRQAAPALRQFEQNIRSFAAASRTGLGPLLAAGGVSALSGTLMAVGIGFDSLREQALLAFEQIYGSASRATAFLQGLQQAALETPFAFSDVLQIGQRLAVVGYSAQQATSLVKLFSDVVSSIPGAGADQLNAITMSFARMRESGVASLGEIETLSAQGIPALQILAEQFGTSTRGMRRMLMRDLPAEMIMTRLEAGLRARFGGLGQKQMDTFRGVVSNIRDIVSQDLGNVMLPFFIKLRDLLRTIVDSLVKLRTFFAGLPQPVKDFVKVGGSLLLILIPLGLALGGIVGAVEAIGTVIGAAAGAVGIIVAVLGGPLALAIAAVILVAAGLYLAWTSNWLGIRDVVGRTVQYFADWFASIVTGVRWLADTTGAVLSAGWGYVAALFQWLVDTVGPIVSGAWGSVVAWFQWLVAAAGATIASGWQWIVSWFQWLVDTVGPIVSGAWQTVVAWFTWLIESAVNVVSSGWANLVDWFTWLVTAAGNVVSAGWQAVASWFTWLWDAAVGAVSGMAQNVVDWWNWMIETIRNSPLGQLIDSIRGAVGGIVGAVGGALGLNTGTSGSQAPIPSMQAGGITRSAGLAYLHPNEAVIPLSGGGGLGGGVTINNYFSGPMLGQDLEDVIVRTLDNARRRMRTD